MGQQQLFLIWILFIRFLCISLVGRQLPLILSFDADSPYNTTSPDFIERVTRDFDWRGYLELYPDLAKHLETRQDAIDHFINSGALERRKFPRLNPTKSTFRPAQKKLRQFLRRLQNNNVPLQKRYLVIYFLDDLDHKYSLEVAVNTLKLFNYSIAHRPSSRRFRYNPYEMNDNVFYWFNVVRAEDNVLFPYVPISHSNVAFVSWDVSTSDFHNHLRTLSLLKFYLSNFGSITFLNQNVRGPLRYLYNGNWLAKYSELLFQNNNGLVTNVINCENPSRPLIELNFFMIRKTMVNVLLRGFTYGNTFAFPKYSLHNNVPLRIKYANRVTKLLYEDGNFNISSYYDYQMYGLLSYDQQCREKPDISHIQTRLSTPELKQLSREKFSSMVKIITSDDKKLNGETLYPYDINYRCNLHAEQVLFMKWGGDFTHHKTLICDDLISHMTHSLMLIQKNHSNELQFFLPETLQGGFLVTLYKEYDLEMWRESLKDSLLASLVSPPSSPSSVVSIPTEEERNKVLASYYKYPIEPDNQVCFLIRTSQMHDEMDKKNVPLVDRVIDEGLSGIIRSLLRQTDPNWLAYFFITDEKPFEIRLQQIISEYNESRLIYFDVPLEFRPKYDPVDAGYTPTDFVLKRLLREEKCRWLSATNGDNLYGSGVVESVRTILSQSHHDSAASLQTILTPDQHNRITHDYVAPDMVLAPLDSRNFPNQDYAMRGTKRHWDQHCLGVLSTFQLSEFGYTVRPYPALARVDLAAVFFNRKRLLEENIFFGNFSDPERYPCQGCQDGYFTEYLVRRKLWKFERLPINGLRSIVFHGPSLTWCLASGNVWFDHPTVSKVRCYSHKIVSKIRTVDSNQVNTLFDWTQFDEKDQICLRFSYAGFLRNQGVQQGGAGSGGGGQAAPAGAAH